jgi:xylan 1,4-beta-xylosidase
MPLGDREILLGSGAVELGVDADEELIQFRWRSVHSETEATESDAARLQETWQQIGPGFDPGKLSDDYAEPLGFTGTFVGVGSYDTSGRRMPAHFDYLRYREFV